MKAYVLSWIRRTAIGFRGFRTWVRVGYPFALIPGVLLLTIWLMGYGWLEIVIVFALGMILVIAEMFNYAIEKLCNLVNTQYDDRIKTVKDICAGTVLVSAAVLVTVALYIIL